MGVMLLLFSSDLTVQAAACKTQSYSAACKAQYPNCTYVASDKFDDGYCESCHIRYPKAPKAPKVDCNRKITCKSIGSHFPKCPFCMHCRRRLAGDEIICRHRLTNPYRDSPVLVRLLQETRRAQRD